MESTDVYDGSGAAFEGDKTFLVRSLPAGAIVKRATLTIAPVAARGGTLFEERIDFASPAGTSRTFGATKLADGAPFVEVDFHKRRTLAAVTGTNVDQAGLQVDLGGVYVEINDKGAILTPSSTPFKLTGGALPGLTVGKFKLTSATAAAPDVGTVTIRSVPSNVTLRLGKTAPFWTYPGELATPVTTPDFAALLQTFLASAAVENGYVLVPLTVHTDGLARIVVTLNVGYLGSAIATPNGLGEAVLPYDAGTVSNAPVQLAVSLPPDARVVAGDTTARVAGQFANTRVVEGYGAPTGAVTVAGAGTVTPAGSLAQIAAFTTPVSATAIDLSLTGVSRTAKLALDLRADLDGKPDGTSLLGAPVPFTFQSLAAPAPGWFTVALAKEFHFASGGPAKYWIVVQSLDGEVRWNLAPSASASGTNGVAASQLPGMQQSTGDWLAWRAAVLANGASAQAGSLTALYRLRYLPDHYQVPLEVQLGTGAQAKRVKLDRYQPLNRVDFTLDAPELASGFNAYLGDTVSASCSRAEHLANGDFRQWHALGGDLGAAQVLDFASTGVVVVSNDGLRAYGGASGATARSLTVIDTFADATTGTIAVQGANDPLFAAASPDGSRVYVGTAASLHVVDASGDADLGTALDRTLDGPRAGAIGPDGASLYVASATGVQRLATSAIEDAVRTRTVLGSLATATASDAAALAISPDGTLLYIADNPAGGRLRALYASSLQARASLPIGTQLTALAVTPDGTHLIALDAAGAAGAAGSLGGTPIAWFVDTATTAVSGSASLPAGTPLALAIAPDGARAYVALRAGDGSLTIAALDLARRTIAGTPLTLASGSSNAKTGAGVSHAAPVTLAMTPAGDRLYVADGALQTLTSIAVGTRIPADWTPFGSVRPARLKGAAPVVVLGAVQRAADEADVGLSQVVPVAPGCAYVFSFAAESAALDLKQTIENASPLGTNATRETGSAPAPDAAADVIWLDAQCGPARVDTIPVPAGERSETLAPYRLAVTAPAGATQAEVRFRAAAGTLLAIGSVSLAGTSDAVTNGDFSRLAGNGTPTGWTTSPTSSRINIATIPATTGTNKTSNATNETSNGTSGASTGASGASTGASGASIGASGASIGASGASIGASGASTGVTDVSNGAMSASTATRLRNLGTQVIELAQSVVVPRSAVLDVEYVGRASAAQASPAIAIDFVATDGSPVGTPASLTLHPGDFEKHPARFALPSGAARANVRVQLPPASALEVRKLVLSFANAVDVPIAFIAQAPGELRVSRAVVAYDRVPLPAPPVPAGGLCTPTPPSAAPGESSGEDGCCQCMQCNARRKTQNANATTTPAGRPATVAVCTACGAQTMQIGGAPVSAAISASTIVPSFVVGDVVRPSAFTARPIPAEPPATQPAPPQPAPPPQPGSAVQPDPAPSVSAVPGDPAARPVTDILGIGVSRAGVLRDLGIVTVDDLASANPADIANALSGVTLATAEGFVRQAQSLSSASAATSQ